jgi:SAM-dependent methyltransferase
MNKNNALTGFFINRFDFIIRFLYCKVGLFKLVNRLMPHVYHSDYESLNGYFQIINQQLSKHGFAIRGKSVLEIGPGNSFINAYNFLHEGARKVTLIDKYPRHCDTDAQRAYVRDEIEYFKGKRNVDRFEYVNGGSCMPDGKYIRFITGDLCEIDFDERVDFIYSIAVLHHIRDLSKYVRKMSDILNSGGMVFHVIDLKDKLHFFGNPFLFYKYSDSMWDRFLTEETMTYTNRVRYGEYLDLFASSGFELLWNKVREYEVPGFRLAPRFAGRDDLHIGDAHLLFRKK